MRAIRLLFALVLLLGVSFKASAQQVTVDFRQVALEKVLDAITSQTGYAFYHSRPTVDPEQIVSLTVTDTKLETALDKLFAGTRIGYEISNRKIYLSEKKTASTPPSAPFREEYSMLRESRSSVFRSSSKARQRVRARELTVPSHLRLLPTMC